MNGLNGGVTTGITVGIVLALTTLVFGFWGFLLVVVFAAIGGTVGAVATGRLDLRAAFDAARGRSRA